MNFDNLLPYDPSGDLQYHSPPYYRYTYIITTAPNYEYVYKSKEPFLLYDEFVKIIEEKHKLGGLFAPSRGNRRCANTTESIRIAIPLLAYNSDYTFTIDAYSLRHPGDCIMASNDIPILVIRDIQTLSPVIYRKYNI